MYRSAHYVVFVNYEHFFDGMAEKLNIHGGEDVWFFSGYDCDSLALEPVTGFVRELLVWLRQHPRAQVELRTKSTQIRSLFETAPLSNVVIAYSLTPDLTAATLEHKAPSVEKRLAALTELAQRGWNVGLRFDPVLYELHYQDLYQRLFEDVFDRVPENRIHSVTLGPFRMPKPYFRNVTRLYPDEALFAGPFESRDKMVSYSMDCEQQMMSFCYGQLLRYTAADKIYTCSPSSRQGVTNSQGQSDPIGRGDGRSI
jgi:spore photoproduct lyase